MKKILTWLGIIPTLGQKIKITWLPSNNAWPTKNCYIGWEGIVSKVYNDNSFEIESDGGVLIITGKYLFKEI